MVLPCPLASGMTLGTLRKSHAQGISGNWELTRPPSADCSLGEWAAHWMASPTARSLCMGRGKGARKQQTAWLGILYTPTRSRAPVLPLTKLKAAARCQRSLVQQAPSPEENRRG